MKPLLDLLQKYKPIKVIVPENIKTPVVFMTKEKNYTLPINSDSQLSAVRDCLYDHEKLTDSSFIKDGEEFNFDWDKVANEHPLVEDEELLEDDYIEENQGDEIVEETSVDTDKDNLDSKVNDLPNTEIYNTSNQRHETVEESNNSFEPTLINTKTSELLVERNNNTSTLSEEEGLAEFKSSTFEVIEYLYGKMIEHNSINSKCSSRGYTVVGDLLIDDGPDKLSIDQCNTYITRISEDTNIATFEIKGNRHTIKSNKIGDEVIISLTLEIKSMYGNSLYLTSEMKRNIANHGSGIIIFNKHKYAGIEPIQSMLSMLDSNYDKSSLVIGSEFKDSSITNLTNIISINQIKNSHYKYIIIDPSNLSKSDINIESIISIVSSSKFVILATETNSVYSSLLNLLSLADGDNFLLNKLLMLTIGIVNPILKLTNGSQVTLEDSEVVSLTGSRRQRILDGDIDRDSFDSYIETPSKVYKLSTDSNANSQDEELKSLLKSAIERNASDIHLPVGKCPMFRIKGQLIPVNENTILTPDILDNIVNILVSSEINRKTLIREKQLGMSYSVSGLGRFRVQISTQRDTYSVVIRVTPMDIPNELYDSIPSAIIEAVKSSPQGLVLFTGGTGTGKSTSTAVVIDAIRTSMSKVIVTLSDPIEYLHRHGKGIVIQREIPTDVADFDTALNAVLRSDPDIIEVGELRTAETIKAVTRFGNSGHLAISTLHSNSVIETLPSLLNRIPDENVDEVKHEFCSSISLIVNQKLITGVDGTVYPIFEYLIFDKKSRQYLLEDKINELKSYMTTLAQSKSDDNARWFDYELIKLYEQGKITRATLEENIREKETLESQGVV